MTTTLVTTPQTEGHPATALALPTPYELGTMSTQMLRTALAQSLTMTAQHLRYLAVIWRELESRGEDLSDLRTGLAVYLPQIASGQLTADAVIRFAGQPTVLRAIATLPESDQVRMARGDSVQVLSAGDDGQYTAVDLPAHTLTSAQVRLLVGPGKLRSVAEQKSILEAAKLATAGRQRLGATAPRVRYDARTDRIMVGRASATVAEMLRAVAEAAHTPAPDADLSKSIVVKLSEAEHRGLAIRAAQASMTQQDYARALLVMQSLIG